LLRPVAYHQATAAARRAAHRALAEVTDADRRAWHLSLATLGPDEHIAPELERLALPQSPRPGPALAAHPVERAAGLGAAEDGRARRQTLAAGFWQHAGAPGRVAGLLDTATRLTGDLRLHGHVQAVRARQELLRGRPLAAHRSLVHESARIRAADPARAAAMLLDAAQACCVA